MSRLPAIHLTASLKILTTPSASPPSKSLPEAISWMSPQHQSVPSCCTHLHYRLCHTASHTHPSLGSFTPPNDILVKQPLEEPHSQCRDRKHFMFRQILWKVFSGLQGSKCALHPTFVYPKKMHNSINPLKPWMSYTLNTQLKHARETGCSTFSTKD